MPHSSRGLSSPDRRANRGRNQLCTENDNIHDNSSSFKNEDSNKSDDNSYEEAPYEKSNHDMNLILFQGASENLGHEQAPLLKNINFLEANEGAGQNIHSSDAMIVILIQKYDDIMLEYNQGAQSDQQAFIDQLNAFDNNELGTQLILGKD